MKTKRIQIFRAGKHTTSTGQEIEFSDADVSALASSYDPVVGHAPAVVGHPRQDSPAYGWVAALSVSDGHLVAELDQVNPEFAEAVRAGAYKHVSAAFYAPNSKANPKPGAYYLRHVGFLGATPPAIKGLAPVEFAEGTPDVEIQIEFSEAGEGARGDDGISNPLPVKSGALDPDRTSSATDAGAAADSSAAPPIAPASEPSPAPASADVPTDQPTGQSEVPAAAEAEADSADKTAPAGTKDDSIASKLAELAAREAELKAREKALIEAEQAARRADATAFAEQMVSQGRVLPRDSHAFVELLLAIPPGPIEFAEGDKIRSLDAGAWLRAIISQSRPLVEFGELAAGDLPKPSSAQLEARIPAIIAEHAARGEPINHMRAAAIAAQEMT